VKFNDVARFFAERPVDEVWGGSSLPVFCYFPYAVSIESTIQILQNKNTYCQDIASAIACTDICKRLNET